MNASTKPKQKEDDLQIACINYLKLQYPHALFCHVPNGGSRNAIEGAKLKRMGVTKGVPDILIFTDRSNATGCAIELKVKPNKPTPEQLEWLKQLTDNNWICKVCYGLDDFITFVDEYFK